MTRTRILVADDQREVREALRLLFKAEGIDAVSVDGPRAALEALRKEPFDAALIDLNYTRDTTSGAEGIELLREIRKVSADLPVVVMTAWGTIDVAVDAMRHGAGDFIEKPWDNQRLMSVIRTQLALADSRDEAAKLKRENEILRGGDGEEPFIAESAAMRAVLARLDRVAPTDANVLILGENGTGKGVIARRLHARSQRASKSLVKVNMLLTRQADVAEMNRRYAEAFGPAPYPARTTCVVASLPDPRMLLEIECVAAVSAG